MNWVAKEVTLHRIEAEGKVSVDYTGIFTSGNGIKVVARRASDSVEVSFVITHDNPNALDDQMIERIVETIAGVLSGAPTGVDLQQMLDRPVEELELSVRSANCLQNANIRLIGELVQKSEADFLKTKNFGRKCLKEIKDTLADMRLTLGMNVGNWQPPKPPPTVT